MNRVGLVISYLKIESYQHILVITQVITTQNHASIILL